MTVLNQSLNSSLVGLIPAAGKGTRIQPLPCSKEVLPVGFQLVKADNGEMTPRPKAVSHYLIESMFHAGARKAYMVINRGKWDLPAYYGPGTMTGVDLAYVVTDYPYGAPYSLKQAFPFADHATVLFGFPDIRFTPTGAFSRLLDKMIATGADLVMGLFRARAPSKMDMVRLNSHGKIVGIDIKPSMTTLVYTWILAVWSPVFTAFMDAYLASVEPELEERWKKATTGSRLEYYVGNVIQASLTSDIKIAHVIFEDGDYVDIGTPESLVATMTNMRIGENEEKK